MQYLEYVATDGACWFDTGIIPDMTTVMEFVTLKPTNTNQQYWNYFCGRGVGDFDSATIGLQTPQRGGKFWAKFGNGETTENVAPPYTVGQTYNVILSKDGVTVDGNLTAMNRASTELTQDTHTLWLAACNNDVNPTGSWANHRAMKAEYGEFKVWTNNVLVADLKPAQSGNSIGFYDTVSQTFKPNLGTGTPTAGPILSSIIVEPTRKVVSYSGNTISASVTTENYWAASIADGSWLSLDVESGVGNTTVNITIDPNSTTSARTDTITFVDMNTTDEMELTIIQKKYSQGQPMYLGGDEISEAYIGDVPLTEAYLGTDLVFAS